MEDIASSLITTFPCARPFSSTSSHDSRQPAHTHTLPDHHTQRRLRYQTPTARSVLFTAALYWCSEVPQNSPSCSAPCVSDSRGDEGWDGTNMKVRWDSNLPTSQTQPQLIHEGWHPFDSVKYQEVNNSKQQQNNKRFEVLGCGRFGGFAANACVTNWTRVFGFVLHNTSELFCCVVNASGKIVIAGIMVKIRLRLAKISLIKQFHAIIV